MKKLFCTFALILTLACCQLFFAGNQKIYAEDMIGLTQENFVTTFTDYSNDVFVLTEDVVLDYWMPINFSGILYGNGYKITLPDSLFSTLTNSMIVNLGVILNSSSIIDKRLSHSGLSNFGILAQNITSSNVLNTYVSGNVNLAVSEATNVGGLAGFVSSGSIIHNCYANVEIKMVQYSPETHSTVVGGFIGSAVGSTISNCYSVPKATTLLNVEVDSNLKLANTNLILGGFIGYAEKQTVSDIINNFCGGEIKYKYELLNKEINVGKIFGEVAGYSAETLRNNHTFNNQDTIPSMIGKTDSYTLTESYVLSNTTFGAITSFSKTYKENNLIVWYEYEVNYIWDTASSWCKVSTNKYISLQVFETFKINIDETKNYLGIETAIQIEVAEDVWENTDITEYKYGSKIRIHITITTDYLMYKNVKSLNRITTDASLNIVLSSDKKSADYYIDEIKSSTAGTFYATTENVQYSLVVKTENNAKGKIKVDSSSANEGFDQKTYSIEYGKTLTYTAVKNSSSYAFSKWAWVGETSTVDAVRGANADDTNQKIYIKFGPAGTDASLTYLSMPTTTIPYVEDEDGNITFTLQASFSDNVCNLQIKTNLGKENTFLIKVGGVDVSNIVDWTSVYNDTIQIGKEVQISIEMNEGFTFNRWESGNGRDLGNYIYNTETDTSTTIHLNVDGDFTLFLNITEDGAQKVDLTWLWISLASLGGVALIVGVVVLIVKRRKTESFIQY